MSASAVPPSYVDYSDDSSDTSSDFAPSYDAGNINAKIAIASIIVFLLAMSTFFTLHLLSKWLFRRFFLPAHRRRRPRSSPSSDGLRFAPNLHDLAHQNQPRGLDKALIYQLLPAFEFAHKNHHQKLPNFAADCAVCLSEFEENEMVRLLPNCSHCFHADCIDMWFFSHSTCPLCRKPAVTPIPAPSDPLESDPASALQLPSDPINSDQTVIDILVVDPNSDPDSAASESDQRILLLHDSPIQSDDAAPPYPIASSSIQSDNIAFPRQNYSRSNSDSAGFRRLLPKPAAADRFLRTISNRRMPHITIQIPPPEIPCSTSSTPKPSSVPSAPSSTRPMTPRCGASFDVSPQFALRNSIKRMLSRQSSSSCCRSSNSLTCGVGSSADHENFGTNITISMSCDRSPKDQQANQPQS